jgi:hypothetical protein
MHTLRTNQKSARINYADFTSANEWSCAEQLKKPFSFAQSHYTSFRGHFFLHLRLLLIFLAAHFLITVINKQRCPFILLLLHEETEKPFFLAFTRFSSSKEDRYTILREIKVLCIWIYAIRLWHHPNYLRDLMLRSRGAQSFGSVAFRLITHP